MSGEEPAYLPPLHPGLFPHSRPELAQHLLRPRPTAGTPTPLLWALAAAAALPAQAPSSLTHAKLTQPQRSSENNLSPAHLSVSPLRLPGPQVRAPVPQRALRDPAATPPSQTRGAPCKALPGTQDPAGFEGGSLELIAAPQTAGPAQRSGQLGHSLGLGE